MQDDIKVDRGRSYWEVSVYTVGRRASGEGLFILQAAGCSYWLRYCLLHMSRGWMNAFVTFQDNAQSILIQSRNSGCECRVLGTTSVAVLKTG